MQKVGCLIDGEHYIPNIKDTMDDVAREYDLKIGIFIGGTEKIGSPEEVREKLGYHVEFAEKGDLPDPPKVAEIAEKYGLDIVLDYSDEPIVNYDVRMEIACEVLARGIIYRGADFEFQPMRFKEMLNKKSLSIWGTGKRVGKTAIGGFVARTLTETGFTPGVVTLSRGGPNKPELLRGDEMVITPEFLLEMQAKGFHAASDNFEDAITGNAITFGCKRCGGGFAGKPFKTIVEEGAKMANEHPNVDIVVLEGSGATFPEIKTDKVILLIGAGQPLHHITGFCGPYRVKFADLVIVAMCEEPVASKEKVDSIVEGVRRINPKAKVVTTIFRPLPLKDIKGKKVLFATTAPKDVLPKLVDYLEKEYECKIIGSTPWLSNRPKLKADIEKYIKEADVLMTEIKAAAIVVVTQEGVNAGLDVVYCDNLPIVTGGDYEDLEEAVKDLVS